MLPTTQHSLARGHRVREFVCAYRTLRDDQGQAVRLPTKALSDPRIAVATLAPLLASETVGVACLRGAGDTKTGMWVMMVVNGINVVVSWALAIGALGLPRWELRGVALGTAVGEGTGGLIVLALLARGRSGLKSLPDELIPFHYNDCSEGCPSVLVPRDPVIHEPQYRNPHSRPTWKARLLAATTRNVCSMTDRDSRPLYGRISIRQRG